LLKNYKTPGIDINPYRKTEIPACGATVGIKVCQ
jgi:hypothetical protein